MQHYKQLTSEQRYQISGLKHLIRKFRLSITAWADKACPPCLAWLDKV